MKSIGKHENLLSMVGYVKDIESPVIALEFCEHGDLLQVLQKHELHFMDIEQCQRVSVCLLLNDLLRVAREVCSGMVYLSDLNYVHRDIAARNVLLTSSLTAKLGDFGLCRQQANNALYVQKVILSCFCIY